MKITNNKQNLVSIVGYILFALISFNSLTEADSVVKSLFQVDRSSTPFEAQSLLLFIFLSLVPLLFSILGVVFLRQYSGDGSRPSRYGVSFAYVI